MIFQLPACQFFVKPTGRMRVVDPIAHTFVIRSVVRGVRTRGWMSCVRVCVESVCVRHTKCKLTMIACDFLVVLWFWQIARFLRLSLLKMLLNISFKHSSIIRVCVRGRAYVFVYHVCLLLFLFLFLSWRRYRFLPAASIRNDQIPQIWKLLRCHKLCALYLAIGPLVANCAEYCLRQPAERFVYTEL